MHKYEIDIFWSAEDGRYIAVVPDLPGCSAHGGTYQQALAEAEIAMAFWLEVAQEKGWPAPEPSAHSVQTALKKEGLLL